MKDKKITITENGIKKEYEIYKICTSKAFKKNYIIYTDNINYYAASYSILDNSVILNEITNDLEWEFIDEELNKNE